jgi:hypothetical protein
MHDDPETLALKVAAFLITLRDEGIDDWKALMLAQTYMTVTITQADTPIPLPANFTATAGGQSETSAS